MKSVDEHQHPVGEKLSVEQRVYRLKVVRTFLRAAVPPSKLDTFRDILEENIYHLTNRRHMSDLDPFITTKEQADIKSEIEGKPVSVAFDGTTRLGEAMAIVIRFVDNSFSFSNALFAYNCSQKACVERRLQGNS